MLSVRVQRGPRKPEELGHLMQHQPSPLLSWFGYKVASNVQGPLLFSKHTCATCSLTYRKAIVLHSCTSQGQQHFWHLPKASPALRRRKIGRRRDRVPSLSPGVALLCRGHPQGWPCHGGWTRAVEASSYPPGTRPKPTEWSANKGNCIFLHLSFSKYLPNLWLVSVLYRGTVRAVLNAKSRAILNLKGQTLSCWTVSAVITRMSIPSFEPCNHFCMCQPAQVDPCCFYSVLRISALWFSLSPYVPLDSFRGQTTLTK